MAKNKKKDKKKDKKKKAEKGFSGDLIDDVLELQELYFKNIDQVFHEFELSKEQVRIMGILNGSNESSLSLRQIRESLPNQTSNATRLVEKLKLKKFVTKRLSRTDKRELKISLTPEGKEALENVQGKLEVIHNAVNNTLKTKESKSLSESLKSISKVLSHDI